MTVVLPARKVLLRSAELLPWLLGGALLWWGLGGRLAFALAGSVILAGAGLLHVASVHGYVVPRPGRVRMAACGCWDVPLAFFVRSRGRGLLFYRSFDPASGELPEEYCVIALPTGCDERSLRLSGFEPPEDSRLIGVVPAGALRFEHRWGDYVDAASLSQALRRASGPEGGAAGKITA